MIPKIIHYCWFGGKPLPPTAIKCIDSWKKYFPDYTIQRWDETNYDVDSIPYTSEAYAAKKYAFVSDYARFDILYRIGGIYFDTDVEVVKPYDDILASGAFMGFETVKQGDPAMVAAGLGLGVAAGHKVLGELIEKYKTLNFESVGGQAQPETVVVHVTRLLRHHGLRDNVNEIQNIEGINIYPPEYFCPLSTVDGKLYLTANTRSIHWYDQSWQSPLRRKGRKLLLKLGGPRLIKLLKPLLLRGK